METQVDISEVMTRASRQGNTMLSLEGAILLYTDFYLPQFKAMLEQSNPASVQQEWGTEGEAAKICGMKPERMRGYLTQWVREGRVRMSQLTDSLGKKSRKRYNLLDVRACMQGDKSCTQPYQAPHPEC